MKHLMFVAALSLASITCASAASSNGNELLEACQANLQFMDKSSAKPDTYQIGFCQGLLHTVLDTVGPDSNISMLKACPPDTVSIGQATRVVTRYLQEHPEQLHLRDTTLAYAAIKKAFPCK